MIKQNEVLCPKCGEKIVFGKPIRCNNCDTFVIPSLIYLSNSLKPMLNLLQRYLTLETVTPKDRLLWSEYQTTTERLSSTFESIINEFKNMGVNLAKTLNFDNEPEFDAISNKIIDDVKIMLKTYEEIANINPPDELYHFGYKCHYENILKSVFNFYFIIKEVAENTQKYLNGTNLDIRLILMVDKELENRRILYNEKLRKGEFVTRCVNCGNLISQAADYCHICKFKRA
ncbi:MAG: hypothetical protein IAX22_06540 [Candidatus Bathyarchaeota archaeon]|nr:hypothetical protein [Candidatus Bathyarchaeota archaeon]